MSTPRKPRPDERAGQLYGREAELIDAHGADDPGPDDDRFPAPSDHQPTGTESSGAGSDEAHRRPAQEQRSKEGEGGDRRR